MPAIITHDSFGHDAYSRHEGLIGSGWQEEQAFLLGNQGPDPFFYSVANPLIAPLHQLGSDMHRYKPTETLAAFGRAVAALDARDQSIGRAYALGFLGHYVLDSTMHPLVYANEYTLCDAGVEGLSRDNGHEVHALIESEYDEMVLFTKTGQTVASFDPSAKILKGSERMLNIASRMHAQVSFSVFERSIPETAFASSVHCFRAVQKLFHSPSGMKRAIIAQIEESVRPYSFYRAMSHRAVEASTSQFDNREHASWENPFTGEESTASFWDLMQQADNRFDEVCQSFAASDFDEDAAHEITQDLNFSGDPVVARIVSVE